MKTEQLKACFLGRLVKLANKLKVPTASCLRRNELIVAILKAGK